MARHKVFNPQTTLSKLPHNTYFRLVKKDGSLSKKTYFKAKDSWNKYSKRYDICSTNDMYGAGREMKGSIKVSTNFYY